MAYRKPLSFSVPPPLEEAVKKLARKERQTVPELVRAALRQYLSRAERQAAFTRAMAYGKTRARAMGIRSEAQLQAILDELRHGKGSSTHASQAARRR
jgi:Arc/MetJ-type ribon-helix-helix transcriptional regulator